VIIFAASNNQRLSLRTCVAGDGWC